MTARHHISIGPVDRILGVEQRAPHAIDGNPFKPRGLWYEVDEGWREWCRDNQDDWISGRHLYRLELDGEDVLRIATERDVDEFTDRYMVALYRGQQTRVRALPMTFGAIDWPAVAARWDGIEIAPYVWGARLKHMWYYGWDCASGCLWRPHGAGLVLEKEAL